MICYICGKVVSSATNFKEGRICDLCNYLLTGKKKNIEADYSITTKEGIVLWIKDLKVKSIWIDNGATAIDLKHLFKELLSREPIKIISFLTKQIERKDIFCAGCGEIIPRSKIAGSHFAGSYCTGCWERYKKTNSRRCGLCNSPMYKCCC